MLKTCYFCNDFMTDREIQERLQEFATDQTRVDWLNDEAWSLSDTNIDLMLKLRLTSKAHTLAKKNQYFGGVARAACCIGLTWSKLGRSELALPALYESLEIYRTAKNYGQEIETSLFIGSVYISNTSHSESALTWFQKALELAQSKNDEVRIADVNLQLSSLYRSLKIYDQALVCANNAKELFLKKSDDKKRHIAIGNEATIHFDMGNNEKFLENLAEFIAYFEKENDLPHLGDGYYWYGKYYELVKDYEKTETMYKKALDIYKRLNDNVKTLRCHLRLCNFYVVINNIDLALHYTDLANREAQFQNNIRYLAASQFQYYLIQKQLKNFEAALEHYVKYGELNDELDKKNSKESVQLMQTMRNLETSEQQNEIYRLRNVELAAAHQSITDSINYAKRIQDSFLPSEDIIKEYLPKLYIFYLPRDIVSGDFFWVEQQGDKLIVALVDCTGHGVPGAFMSIVGATLLHESVKTIGTDDTAAILFELDKKVRKSLKQDAQKIVARDGMDAALCIIDTKTNTLKYSGAGRPLYFYRKDELTILPCDKFPIGWSTTKEKNFTIQTKQLLKGDRIYLFSDGFVDQFGLDGRIKKFTPKRLQALLNSTQGLDIAEQGNLIGQTFQQWKGDEKQLDDVTLMAFEW